MTPRDRAAALELVGRVRRGVPAELWRAFVFGSRARGEGRPDSDVDVLLVFRRLPPDREPQAGMAEALAEEVAAYTGVPVTVWSVSLVDLEPGNRTPMLVDALDDGIPLWPPGAPRVPLRFGPQDALRCAGALLERVREGGEEASARLLEGDRPAAWLRMRDDLVRLCTAGLLLSGETRPRRGDAVRRYLARRGGEVPGRFAPLLAWAAGSYGPEGRDDEAPVPPPPGGVARAAELIDLLRRRTARRREVLARRLAAGNPHPGGT
ncbi:MAG TPA: nucleotidyltransferase domain-containing protein [Longimicrobiaceae bacterium]|nr:nucleotidyltransferase domain-containing protein [Longimicrobiaceae bacterium]